MIDTIDALSEFEWILDPKDSISFFSVKRKIFGIVLKVFLKKPKGMVFGIR